MRTRSSTDNIIPRFAPVLPVAFLIGLVVVASVIYTLVEMASKVLSAAKTVVSPVTMAAGAVHQFAAKKVAFTEGELADKISQHKAQGTDLASTATKDFITLQLRSIPYRTERLADELTTLTGNNGQYIRDWRKNANYKDYIVAVRFLIRLVALFMLGKMMCRGSMLPLIEPTSPLLPGIYEFHNPNKW
jgi:hypothetical protein